MIDKLCFIIAKKNSLKKDLKILLKKGKNSKKKKKLIKYFNFQHKNKIIYEINFFIRVKKTRRRRSNLASSRRFSLRRNKI